MNANIGLAHRLPWLTKGAGVEEAALREVFSQLYSRGSASDRHHWSTVPTKSSGEKSIQRNCWCPLQRWFQLQTLEQACPDRGESSSLRLRPSLGEVSWAKIFSCCAGKAKLRSCLLVVTSSVPFPHTDTTVPSHVQLHFVLQPWLTWPAGYGHASLQWSSSEGLVTT